MEQADAAERALADGRPVGPLHGVPIAIKDLTPTEGQADDDGLVRLRALDSGRERPRRREAARRRRDHGRQDDDARVRLLGVHREPPVGCDAEPVGPDTLTGRVFRRLGRRGGVGVRSPRRGQRHGGLGPDPGLLVRHRRTEAELRADPARLPPDPVRHDPAPRAAGPDRGGRAPLPRRQPGPRRARHHVALAAARPLGAARPVRRRHAPRSRRRPRLLRGRTRGRGFGPRSRGRARPRGSGRRGGRPRLGRGRSPTPGSITGASTWRPSSATSSASSGSRWIRAS